MTSNNGHFGQPHQPANPNLHHLATEALRAGRYAEASILARALDDLETVARRDGARAAGEVRRQLLDPPADERAREVPLVRPVAPRLEQTHIMQAPGSHAPTHCTWVTEVHGSRRVCHQPIRWEIGTFGDMRDGHPAQMAGWVHVDATIVDHEAQPATVRGA